MQLKGLFQRGEKLLLHCLAANIGNQVKETMDYRGNRGKYGTIEVNVEMAKRKWEV